MKISESNVQLASQSSYVQRISESETLVLWDNRSQSPLSTKENIRLDISDRGRAMLANQAVCETEDTEDNVLELTDLEKEKIRLIQDFIYVLTGKRIKFLVPRSITKDQLNKLRDIQGQTVGSGSPQRAGWGLDYTWQRRVEEYEKMDFSSSGSVTTQDGRVINFNLSFSVSREFVSNTQVRIQAGDALLDPLVINLRNASASLGDRNYSFDIDMDGKPDNIAFTAEGSGFLAWDRNGNGIIDDGSELFGPSTGNGFEELSLHDSDGNNWIDESDPIYEKLRIWTLDEEGNKQLITLGQAGVGAIYLGHLTTPFSLRDGGNNPLGQISRTGVFLHEDGTPGAIQHVDLVI
ncbi:MAG: hypothetical protein GX384_05830 [Clostridiaceae bacterium]|jgi:hypothetical protein|nr:hypothetical protein [Bacillota bacterium]NLI38848.1 hypothetical protein [Clostridiaceae bacterium]